MSYILLRKVIFQLPNGIFHFFLAFPFGAGSPEKWERWQTKSDGEGASAAEVKWLDEMK